MLNVQIELLDNDILLMPEQKNPGDAGFDLKAAHDDIIPAKEHRLIKCGFSIAIPPNHEGQVRSRSGLALKAEVFVLNSPGTIDMGYRGMVGVILQNLSDTEFVVKKYDRIAQLVINEIPQVTFEVVKKLSETERGVGGFGSTGVK